MTQPLIVTQLRAKQAEVEASIESMTARIAEARHDLIHLAATLRLFDPDADDKPATVYHGATKALNRSAMLALCRAALEASPDPLCTRQLARHIVQAEGWDVEDRRLRLTVAHKVGLMLARFEKRGVVAKAGVRNRATVWRLV